MLKFILIEFMMMRMLHEHIFFETDGVFSWLEKRVESNLYALAKLFIYSNFQTNLEIKLLLHDNHVMKQ